MSRITDLEIYSELICLGKEVQEESFRAKMIEERLHFGGFGSHDTAIVSYFIHKHFEEKDDLDITLI